MTKGFKDTDKEWVLLKTEEFHHFLRLYYSKKAIEMPKRYERELRDLINEIENFKSGLKKQ